MAYISKSTVLENSYRKIEAMYRRGYTTNEIVNSLNNLSKYDVLDIIQKIFYLDTIRNARV